MVLNIIKLTLGNSETLKLHTFSHLNYDFYFFRIRVAEVEYKESFEDEKTSFIERIRKRAKEKLEIAIREEEEKERLARLGPGGLDPVEVFESLPAVSTALAI